MPSMGTSPASWAPRTWPTPPSFGRPTITWSMRRLHVEARCREGVVVRPGVAGLLVAGCLPRVAEDDPGTGDAARPVSMRISSLCGSALRSPHTTAGNRRRPRLAHEAADLGDLLLADRAVVVGPAQVCAEHLKFAAGPVDLGEHAQPLLALFVDGVVGASPRELAHLVALDRPPRDHCVAGARTVAVEVGGIDRRRAAERGRDLGGLVARVVFPGLLQRDDVGVDRAAGSR